MIKVFIVLPNLNCGGAEKVSLIISKILKHLNYDVYILNIGPPEGELSLWLSFSDIKIISLSKKHVSVAIVDMYRLLKEYEPDFIFSSLKYTSTLVLLLSFFIKSKIILREPTMPYNKLFKGKKVFALELLNRFLYTRAYKIVTQTKEMQKEVLSHYYKLSDEKVFVLRNPIDTDLIQKLVLGKQSPFGNNDKQIFLAVGNISIAKGYDTLLEAFEMYNNLNSYLYIIGRDNTVYAQELKNKFKDYKSFYRVIFLGFQNNPYLYMKYCDCFVLSSRMEGYPNVLNEAMYLKKKIIATSCVPAIGDMLKEYKQSIIVPVDSVIDISQAMYDIEYIEGDSSLDISVQDEKIIKIFSL